MAGKTETLNTNTGERPRLRKRFDSEIFDLRVLLQGLLLATQIIITTRKLKPRLGVVRMLQRILHQNVDGLFCILRFSRIIKF